MSLRSREASASSQLHSGFQIKLVDDFLFFSPPPAAAQYKSFSNEKVNWNMKLQRSVNDDTVSNVT